MQQQCMQKLSRLEVFLIYLVGLFLLNFMQNVVRWCLQRESNACPSRMLCLGIVKMKKWNVWGEETQTLEYQIVNDSRRFRFTMTLEVL